MCGLFGIVGPYITHPDLEVFEQMSLVSSVRGLDATGVMKGRIHNTHDELVVAKEAMPSQMFLKYNKFHKDGSRDLFNGIFNHFFCGHVRYATKGALTKENAHPFDVGDIVGMHNGTLKDKKYEHPEKTDSEFFLKDIEENGIFDVLSDLHPKSAYAIVYFDKRDKKLYFARNSERELYFAVNKDSKVIYYASEPWIIRNICARNGVKLLGDTVYYFNIGKVYSIDPTNFTHEKNPFDEQVFTLPSSKNYQKIDYSHYNNYNTHNKTKGKKENKKLNNVITLPKVSYGTSIDKNKPSKLIPARIPISYCCVCQKSLTLFEQWKAEKYAANAWVCQPCNDQTDNSITA